MLIKCVLSIFLHELYGKLVSYKTSLIKQEVRVEYKKRAKCEIKKRHRGVLSYNTLKVLNFAQRPNNAWNLIPKIMHSQGVYENYS